MSKQDILKTEFLRGRVSRRDFVSGMATFGLGAVAAGHLADDLIATARASEPKSGGHLNIATSDGAASDNLDPATLGATFNEIAVSWPIFNRLIEYRPELGGLQPGIFTAWESNGDATEWAFDVREGVEFHNGKTLTSADIVYCINRVRDPETASNALANFTSVTDVVADGPGKVILRMSEPFADAPFLMTLRNLFPAPEGYSDFNGAPVGTGPWKVENWEPGIGLRVVRNENYWRDGKPYVDSLEIFSIGDDNARLNALLSGEADIAATMNPSFVERIQSEASTEAMIIAGAAHATFPMRSDTAPFNDPDVAKALKHAFDRERFRQIAFNGYGGLGRDHPVPEGDVFYCDDIPVPQYDPDMVKSLLKKAGHENTEFELFTSDANYGGANAAVALGELMREGGVNVKVTKTPADGYWSAVWMQKPWTCSSWTGRATTDQILSMQCAPGAAYNETYWSNERFGSLLVEARGEPDFSKRSEIYCELQRMTAEMNTNIIPIFVPWIDGKATKVQGLVPNPLQFMGSGYWDGMWIDESAA